MELSDSLALLALFVDVSKPEQESILEQVYRNQEKRQTWAQQAPTDLHKFYLVEAELHRVLGKYLEAMEYYDKAITLAHKHEYLEQAALANELAAKFYLSWGKEKIAQVYLTDAYNYYLGLGATVKVETLEKQYPHCLQKIPNSSISTLDLPTILPAYQAIARELDLDKLLKTLLKIIMTHTRASSGCLLIEENGEFFTAATGKVDEQITVFPSLPNERQQWPPEIINHVVSTKEILILNHANQTGEFTKNPYIKNLQIPSILCVPLLNQHQISAIVYLENNLTTEAFTTDKIEFLKLLSSQAAIAIANARLHANLATKFSQTITHLQAIQNELIQSEKMVTLGQLLAGIAHEINTPLAAIRASANNTTHALSECLNQLPQFWKQLNLQQQTAFFALINRAIHSKDKLSTKEKRQLKRDLSQQLEVQGISQVRQIADACVDMGISQDIDAFMPLFTSTDVDWILQLAYNLTRLQSNNRNINNAVERATKIVCALKTYARYDNSGIKQIVPITDGIETVLELYHNQLKQGVEVIRNYQPVPPISCYPDELIQVWTNLVHNAIQAMSNQGTLAINVCQQNNDVVVQFVDSGCGISPEIQARIFEPFFTTKPAGEGSGLGLDIVKKILDKHTGNIQVESVPEKTIFTVYLPINL